MELLREATVLTAPNETFARERTARARRIPRQTPRPDFVEDFADVEDEGGYNVGRRRTGLRLTFHGGAPKSLWGRVATAAALFATIGVLWLAATFAHRMVLRDQRFVLTSSASIETRGNHHLSRAQLLDVFSPEIGRNLLETSLDTKKSEMEQIPWVRRCTIMRLLPDHLRVVIEERTPVAFVRQAGHIGLVDAGGVLLDMGVDSTEGVHYSFPVVTGISGADPLSVRAARMKIYGEFTKSLDATGERISDKLSEIDLSNPEDVKALIADRGADVLVHFGEDDYLERYRRYEAHLAEWRAQYPKLSAVDMRYERQVVLEMQPGTVVPLAGAPAGTPPNDGQVVASATKLHSPGSKAHVIAGRHVPVSGQKTAQIHDGVKAGHR